MFTMGQRADGAAAPETAAEMKGAVRRSHTKSLHLGQTISISKCSSHVQVFALCWHLNFEVLFTKIRIFKPLPLPRKTRCPFFPQLAFPPTWEKFSLDIPGDC